MSNTKPTYAAIVNSDSTSADSGVAGAGSTAVKGGSPATAASAAGNGNGAGAGPSDAPPPYSAPSHPAQHQHQTQPHQTILPPPRQPQVFYTGQHLESGFVNGAGGAEAGAGSPWVQPPPHVAKSRAIRRFWGAFFWAWVIWILVGLLIGGGISDVNSAPPHRHGHWDKHGDWHNDRLGVGVIHPSSVQAQAQAQEVSVAGDLLPDFAS